MDIFFELSTNKVHETPMVFKRYLLNGLPKNQRLAIVQGPRGAGKTTMLLQYIKETSLPAQKALYLSLDDILISTVSLSELADKFYKGGGQLLVLDEVHKYPDWSREIKTMYDRYSKLQLLVTCSSALILSEGAADLSRRSLVFNLNELSLREFTELKYGITFPAFNLKEVTENHENLTNQITSKIKPLMVFNEYLQHGAFPFFVQGPEYYLKRLAQVIALILESDLPAIDNIAYGTVVKLRKLLGIIAESVPFKPNIAELSQKVQTTRDQLLRLLYLLEKASVIYQLRNDSFGMSFLAKPEKIYLHNPNIARAITYSNTNRGTDRETFFINQVSALHKVAFSGEGDFLVDNALTFEIGGKSKPRKQIEGLENAFLVKDDIEHGSGNTIPLWLFGFLY
jgi:predicted AAA+ superfamily ATPase